jgi:hypothetical protein
MWLLCNSARREGSTKGGNIKGQNQPRGNPFEAPRSREYPTPMKWMRSWSNDGIDSDTRLFLSADDVEHFQF